MKKLGVWALLVVFPIVSLGWEPGKTPTKVELKKILTPQQYEVTQNEGTEQPFKNQYWDNHEEGIYVDIVSGEPLFSSADKFDSKTGWPSFTKPLAKDNIVEKEDRKLFSVRTEVRSKHGQSHLGHIFTDGPKPTGLRYCVNSAALKFIPKDKLKEQGYGEYVSLFEGPSDRETAIFAGGCFWCMEPSFDTLKKDGVISVMPGYSGGHKEAPTYSEVSKGGTGHREVVEIIFDSKKITYEKLLDVFWVNVDPFDETGQFCDKGEQYTSIIYYANEAQKKAAEASVKKFKKLAKGKGEFKTQILPAKKFYAAEDYHQSYYTKNPIRYKTYRYSCGRDKRLKQIWGSAARHD